MAAAEASAPFLGLRPGSRDPGAAAASRRRSRGPRNRKKGWKRLSGPEAKLGREIADFLEDVALEQRTTGGLISEQPDEDLFFLDTGNATKDKGQLHPPPAEKPLHVDLVLQPLSKVPAPKDILSYQIPNARKLRRRREFWAKQAEKGLFPREERRLRKRLNRDPPPPRPPRQEKGRSDPQRGFYDLWGDNNPLDQALVGQDQWFLQQTKRLKVKRPARLQPLPEVPALEVIDGGGSYNPAFGEHQALLLRAHEEELKKQREEEKLERQLKIPAGIPLPTPETVFQEQCEGLLEEGEEEEEEEEEAEPRGAPKAPKGKKTEQQRRREKEARALAQQHRQQAAARRSRQALFRLRALRRHVALWEAELRRRRTVREAARREERARPRRVGRMRYQEPAVDVQLSHELPESLRALKPEGSILRDRFKSFQKRNMIEPRERAKFKRRYRLKYVEKRAFRAVTL